MRAVNLLPRDVQQARSEGGRTPLFVAAGGAAAVTAAGLVLFLTTSSAVGDQEARLDEVEAAIASVPEARKPVVAPSAVARERTQRLTALSAALGSRTGVERLLRELALVLPDDAWLTGLSASAGALSTPSVPGGPPPPTTSAPGVTIDGATYTHSSVARVLARLSALPTLRGVRLAATARTKVETSPATQKKRATTQTIVTFTITADLAPGGAA